MSATTHILPDLASMKSLAAAIADSLAPGDVIALDGPLGAGKTTLARFILEACGYAGEVPSPTFTLVETYDPPATRLPIVHADFYRLQNPREAEELGLTDYREGAALLAEWPDHAGGFAHESRCLSIALEFVDNGRRATVNPGAAWLGRWP